MSKKKEEKKTKKQKIKQITDKHQGWIIKAFLLSSILLILLGAFYQYWLHKQYQKTLALLLPNQTTVFAIEINQNQSLDQVQSLQGHPYKSQILELLNPDLNIFSSKTATQLNESSQKVFSYQLYQEQLHPTFIYRLKTPLSSANQLKKTKGITDKWYYFSDQNILVISTNPDLNKFLLNKDNYKYSVSQNQRFQDSFNQLPLHNLSHFYINHQLLPYLANDTLFPQNQISQLLPFTNTLGFTTGYLKVRDTDLLLGTYTNLQDESQFYFSPKSNLLKYNPSLTQYVPKDSILSFYGTQLEPILNVLVQNHLKNSSQTQAPLNQSLKSILISQNLDPKQDFQLIQKLLKQEYAAYIKDRLYITIPKQTIQSQQQLLDLVSRLEAHYNPQIISYQLPDGSTARNLVSSEPKTQLLEDSQDKIFTFNLSESNSEIIIDFSNPEYDLLSLNLEDLPETPETLPQLDSAPLLSVGSSHSTISNFFLEYLLYEKLNQEISFSIPNTQNSFYYFDDGLQSVSSLTW